MIKFPARAAFSMPRLSGHHQLRELVHQYGGRERVTADFHIAQQALDAYLAGVMEPPLSLLLALYWQGPMGFGQAFSETHFANLANVARARAAEAKLDQYRTVVHQLRVVLGDSLDTLLKDHGIDDAGARAGLTPSDLAVAGQYHHVAALE